MKKLILTITVLFSFSTLANEAVEALGERLFNDIRFSEHFLKVSAGDVNYELTFKDRQTQLDTIVIREQEHPSPFSGSTVSCASCHMVDQAFDMNPGGMRGYNDFAIRTKIPLREDGRSLTLRNTPALIGIGSKYSQNRFSHHDGEFQDHSQTVLGNFSGRNMGWLKVDSKKALKNIVNVIKKDNGLGDLAQDFGGAYNKIMLGLDPLIPEEFRIPKDYQLDVFTASDKEILEKVVLYVTAYLDGIDFEKDENGLYNGSPYDEFLRINNLPLEPAEKQSIAQYSASLIREFIKLKNPKFVSKRRFDTHDKSFEFNEKEWSGLKTFFNIGENKQMIRGMCVNCHMPPLFTDQFFHNVGVVQFEYDKIHSSGEFVKLQIPGLLKRQKQYFLDNPSSQNKNLVDLGMWNFFGRNGKEVLTNYVKKNLCANSSCSNEELLPYLTARFKTPTLRNLGHSAPYLHNGASQNIGEVIDHYIEASKLMKVGELRNGAPQLRMMNLKSNHKEDLKAFLNSLNENYE
ncbi:MAG: cytochrome c peroxidase [Bacteriovoracaceae bacterium]|jgi:cytochrome c peroxidase